VTEHRRKGLPAHKQTWLDSFFDRMRPAFLAGFFVLATTGVVAWLETSHERPAVVFIASLLVAVAGFVVETLREISQLREELTEDEPVKACWSEQETVTILKRYDAAAPPESHVKAVWGALAFSNDFPAFIKDQLLRLSQSDYHVERWIDASKVEYATLVAHLRDAEQVIRDGKYIVHLVPDAWFGAMVVDSQAAAINFQAHPDQRGVIGLYGEDPKLAKRVTSMINQLTAEHEDLRLPSGAPQSATVDGMTKQVREYYGKLELSCTESAPASARRLLSGAWARRRRRRKD
jgi:hypothetical protein